jgi:CBS domain-containing protein
LRAEILQKTQKGSLFQAFMAANALNYQPPLGIFKGFVLEKTGDNVKALDMKKRGVVPVIDLARVYSLAHGIPKLNTSQRLDAIAEAPGGLSKETIADLKDAFDFISTTRLEHQALQIEAGKEPDNFVPPEQLSALERRHLKDAFAVVSDVQSSMEHSYQAGRFR